jgi:hypothetical protein
MSHFAKVENGIVTRVIVIEQSDIDMGHWGDPSLWIQTSYNTRGGIHYGQDGQPDGGVALRANYAAAGMIYDAVNDVFYTPRPKDHKEIECASWTISAPNWEWKPPTPRPIDDNPYVWDETTKTWIIDAPPTGEGNG